MNNYVFMVRDWNITFFQDLKKIVLEENGNASFHWLVMTISAFKELNKTECQVYYMPHLLAQGKYEVSVLKDFDNYLFKEHGYGVQYLYETERFKPQNTYPADFINAHVQVLYDIIPENSTTLALSCDHFIYILSSYIARFKNGQGYYIQPIGFPMNAQVILKTPWDVFPFRTLPLDSVTLNNYIESLSQDPMESIHYMKPQKRVSLAASIAIRFKGTIQDRPSKSDYTYLDPLPANIIPGRFRESKSIRFKFNYFNIDAWRSEYDNQKIFYFPLQFEPEMSIEAYSPWCKNQLEVIRMVSQSLKIGDILLLKENTKMIGNRDVSFYKQVSKYRNVVWAKPEKNSREIIKKSFKVLSITGTATIEAACLGVNSLLFGYPPFRLLIIEKPVADQTLSNMVEILYRNFDPEVIIRHVNINWPEYSRSIIIDNYIPEYVVNKFTLRDSEKLANNFICEVLSFLKSKL